jgi:hypothetical protein
VRVGAQAVAPLALFGAILAGRWPLGMPAPLWSLLGQIILVIAIGIQTFFTASGGILSLQDGQYGISCAPAEPIAIYLAQHYDGGRILEDVNSVRIAESEAGIELKNTIYEGSGEFWQKALSDPAAMVEWIIVPAGVQNSVIGLPVQDDPIAKRIDLKSPAFLSQFTLVVQEPYAPFLRLYHRNGRSPLPTRPIPASLLSDHRLCPLFLTR